MKNPLRNPTQNDSGAKASRKPRPDTVRLATLGGVALLVAVSFGIWRSIDRIQSGLDSRLSQIENRLAQVSGKMDTAAAQNQPARRGPDPNRVYAINTTGSPVRGPAGAAITIAEFSDFQ